MQGHERLAGGLLLVAYVYITGILSLSLSSSDIYLPRPLFF
jgi:hypothetical protein